jgi:protein TonB
MVRALLLSSLLVTIAFALALSLSPFFYSTRVVEIPPPLLPHNPEVIDILRPPPLAPPIAAIEPPSSVPAVDATPVPKQDALVPEDQTIKSQPDYVQDATSKSGPAGGITIQNGIGDEPVNDAGKVAFVDRFPEPIVRVKPRYPDLAHQAGVEGTVMVFVLVGKDGRVREVKLDPEKHQPMLDAAALEAARTWTFEPAVSNGRAVPVWVSVPFKFALR